MYEPLSYETCCKLRDAGFPQSIDAGGCYSLFEHEGATEAQPKYFRLDEEGNRWLEKSDYEPIGGEPNYKDYRDWYVACPSSDELLAALQAEYGKCYYLHIESQYKVGPHEEHPWAATLYAKSLADRSRQAIGDTPAAALAALYLALKETT